MHTAETGFGVCGNHLLQSAAADELKTAAYLNSSGKITVLPSLRLGTECSNLRHGSLADAFAALDTTPRDEIPIHRFEWIQGSCKVLIEA